MTDIKNDIEKTVFLISLVSVFDCIIYDGKPKILITLITENIAMQTEKTPNSFGDKILLTIIDEIISMMFLNPKDVKEKIRDLIILSKEP